MHALRRDEACITSAPMKSSECEILIVPGYNGSGPDHWQSRWQGRLSSARRVEQDAWSKPVREDWVDRLVGEVERARKPVVLIGHSLGAAICVLGAREIAVVHAVDIRKDPVFVLKHPQSLSARRACQT